MVVIGVLQLLAILCFLALVIAAVGRGELRREIVRAYWRLKPFASSAYPSSSPGTPRVAC